MPGQTARDRAVYDAVWSTTPPQPPSDTAAHLVRLAVAEHPAGAPRVADLGCGPGRHALHAARSGAVVTAIDHNRTAIARLRASAAAEGTVCEVVSGDAFDWLAAQPPASLDGIVCFDSVHHGRNDPDTVAGVVATMADRLRTGGLLLVTLLCSIRYSTGERLADRLALDAAGGRALLDRALDGSEVLRDKQKAIRIADATSVDPATGDLTGATYEAIRVLRLVRV